MGWTSYHATHYTKNWKVNKKAECDAYFEEGLNRGHYKVMASSMKGNVYYAAVKALLKRNDQEYIPIPENEQIIFGVVILTSVDNKSYFNFSYKIIDETMGPGYYDCPITILNSLSETEDDYALEWRDKCRKEIQKRKSKEGLDQLPIGSKIEIDFAGKKVILTKSAPAYQFKKPFWRESVGYWSKKNISSDYRIVSKGGKEC